MKNFSIIIGIILIVAIGSCKKDDLQPRFPDYVFFEQGKTQVYDRTYPYMDKYRSPDHPLAYDSLTKKGIQDFDSCYRTYILPELDKLTKEVNTKFRSGPEKKSWTAQKVFDKVNPGFHPLFYNFAPDFCEALYREIENYVLNVVDGPPDWSSGTADEVSRDAIYHFLDKREEKNNPWDMTWKERIAASLHKYAVDGKIPKDNRNGWLLFKASK